MEIRKFIVERRPDGSFYVTEYEEPEERIDIRNALRKVDIDCCCEIGQAWLNHEKYAVDALDRVEKSIEQVLSKYWH